MYVMCMCVCMCVCVCFCVRERVCAAVLSICVFTHADRHAAHTCMQSSLCRFFCADD